jgi:hypothetical protein
MNRRHIAIILLSLGFISLTGFSPDILHAAGKKKKKGKPTPTLEQVFQPTQLKEDLRILQEILETSHSGMYLYTPKEEFNQGFKKAGEILDNKTTRLDFYRTVAPLVEKVRCGHTYFDLPEKLINNLMENGRLFPVPVFFLAQKAYVDQKEAFLPLGAEITSINGVLMQEILNQLLPYLRSDGLNQTMKYRQMADEFALHHYLHFGEATKFQVTYRPAGEKNVLKKLLNPIPGKELGKLIAERHSDKGRMRKYKLKLVDKEIALLTVDSFDFGVNQKSRQRYRQFLKDNFDALEQNEEIRSLILDLRRNEGGYVGNDSRLFSYFARQPFRDAQSVEAISQKIPQQEHLAKFQFPRMIEKQLARDFRKDETGRYFMVQDKNPEIKPRRKVFDGTVHVLTSGWTHSAGAVLASQFLNNDNVVFIGEETGGGHAAFTAGDMMLYDLPNTRCQLEVPLLLYRNNPGLRKLPKGSGVQPDHPVTQTQEDFIRGVDTILEFALKMAAHPKS